jgi:hypothetical protein
MLFSWGICWGLLNFFGFGISRLMASSLSLAGIDFMCHVSKCAQSKKIMMLMEKQGGEVQSSCGWN